MLVRLIGILSGWFFGYGAWKMLSPHTLSFSDFYLAVGVGFVSPVTYMVLFSWAAQKWTWLGKAISGRPDGSI